MTMTHLTLSSLLLTAAATTATATVDETKFHTYQHPKTNEPRLVLKPVDVAGFYNHPKAAKRTEGRNLEKLEVATSGNTYDINICNLSVDKQDLKLLPEAEGEDAVHLATLQKFSCIEATVTEGLKLCFHAKQHHLSSRECQYQATSFQEDGDMMFDPYEHYNELADITGQLEYHGLTTLEPDDLESYLNLKAEMDSATEYRRLSNGQRHLMIATRHESDHQAAHRETMEDAGLKMWNSDYYGQEHLVDENMVIKAVANSPRVFDIQDFLSKDELKHIQELSSEDSAATTLHRYDSNQLEEIFQRVSKVFQVDEHQDHEMQVHHASGASAMPCHHSDKIKIHPKEHSQRIASLIMFLDDSEEQEVQFERWEHLEEHEDTLRLKGNAGNALLVYHMLEDGNSDEFAHWTFSGKNKYATIHLSDELLKKMVVHEPLDY